jgi:catechol 2,3-dioxygenase-like lactoylglutathione lyase family enzyme
MLNTAKLAAFLPTTDFDRARAFFEGVMGLRYVTNDGHALVMDSNGTMIRISKVQPDFKPQQFTILGWQVPDIESAVDDLAGRGVTFERYGFFVQDERGIWTAPTGDRVAWSKDPDGNTLSLSQHV